MKEAEFLVPDITGNKWKRKNVVSKLKELGAIQLWYRTRSFWHCSWNSLSLHYWPWKNEKQKRPSPFQSQLGLYYLETFARWTVPIFFFNQKSTKLKEKSPKGAGVLKIFSLVFVKAMCFHTQVIGITVKLSSLVPCCAGSCLDGKGRLPVPIIAAACSREKWHASHF